MSRSIKRIKRKSILGAIMIMLMMSISASAITVEAFASKNLLKKEGAAAAYDAVCVDVLIVGKNGSWLAAGQSALYSSNGFRVAECSYTGLSSADYAYGVGANKAGTTASDKRYY